LDDLQVVTVIWVRLGQKASRNGHDGFL